MDGYGQPTRRGHVYLVGAGPGDIGLITVRGAECLGACDVVVYDRLANPGLLDLSPAAAERVDAGKAPGRQAMTQDAINATLSDRAAAGARVVRLKGGDPFVFGRGGEEAAWLVSRGIPFEVVPGITSAIAAPAYAGIPVTHRHVAASFSVVTGHESPEGAGGGQAGGGVDWDGLGRGDGTVVVLMGVERLDAIAARLIAAGRPPDTPAALIGEGTRAAQRVLTATLATVADEARRKVMKPPAVLVVGPAAALRGRLAWAEARPMHGLRVAVTRPAGRNGPLSDAFRWAGAEVMATPTIRVVPGVATDDVRSALAELARGGFQWTVFTSATAVEIMAGWLRDAGQDTRAFAGCGLAAVGVGTTRALERIGLTADFASVEDPRQEGLGAGLRERLGRGNRVLFPAAAGARDALAEALGAAGTEVRRIEAYRTEGDPVGIDRLCGALASGALDMVTFTSASTFARYAETVGPDEARAVLAGVGVASVGPVTSAALRSAGVAVAVESPRPDMACFAEACAGWWGTRRAEADMGGTG